MPSIDALIAARRARPLLPLWDRFWAKVDTSGGEDACWPWRGAMSYKSRRQKYRRRRGTNGRFCRRWYRGVIQEAGRGSRILQAHRVALCFKGEGIDEYDLPFEDGTRREAGHTCNNRICCNPNHLRWVTPEMNQKERYGG